jgi:hypothetical protein
VSSVATTSNLAFYLTSLHCFHSTPLNAHINHFASTKLNPTLQINQDRFRAPEILFNPSQIGLESAGLHTLVTTAIARTDLDLRAGLYSSIVLSGGTTLTRRFGDRLLYELKRSVAAGENEGVKIRILAPPERKWTTWIGGSILGGLSSFRNVSALNEARVTSINQSVMGSECEFGIDANIQGRCGLRRRNIRRIPISYFRSLAEQDVMFGVAAASGRDM